MVICNQQESVFFSHALCLSSHSPIFPYVYYFSCFLLLDDLHLFHLCLALSPVNLRHHASQPPPSTSSQEPYCTVAAAHGSHAPSGRNDDFPLLLLEQPSPRNLPPARPLIIFYPHLSWCAMGLQSLPHAHAQEVCYSDLHPSTLPPDLSSNASSIKNSAAINCSIE